MPKMMDIAGHVFGRLTAVDRTAERKNGSWVWRLRCECGSDAVASVRALRAGAHTSCGCGKVERAKTLNASHGHAKDRVLTKTYSRWLSMRKRCSPGMSRNRPDWPLYVGRGIKVAERWNSFQNFLADMGECPAGMTLDRIDPDGDYAPGNCRWASPGAQSVNKRDTVMVTWGGSRMPLKVACDDAGVNYQNAYSRVVRSGRNFDDAVRELRGA